MSVLRLGAVEIELTERRVRRSGSADASLTALEATFLAFLALDRGATVTRERLLVEVWGYSPQSVTRAVDNTVHRLRRKIEDDPGAPRWLTSGAGGYRLEREPRVSAALPAEPSSFVGRAAELAAIDEALRRHRVVALVGLGGIGKSRLALRAAQAWEATDGEAVVVPVARVVQRGAIVGRVAEALGVHPSDLRTALEERPRLLVVLDEVEQAADAELSLVDRGAAVLLTSTRPIDGTHRIEVGPMTATEAAELVGARCPGVSPDGADEVAAAVDGIPFAIELAARWLAASPPSEVAARIRSLRGEGTGRHGTVDAALAGSWELLDPGARALLGYAAAFAGPFGVADLEALTGRGDGLPVSADLAGRGWLHRVGDRLVVYTVVRRFLADRGAVPADAAQRHLDWLLGWVPAAQQADLPRWDSANEARLRRAAPELRQAVAATEDPAARLELLCGLHRRGEVQGQPIVDALAELDQVGAALPADSPHLARLLLLRGCFQVTAGEAEASLATLRRALALVQTASPGAIRIAASIVGMLGNALSLKGEREAAMERYREAAAMLEAAGSETGAAIFRMNLGSLLVRTGDLEGAESMYLRVLGTPGVHPATFARTHANLANLYNHLGSPEACASHQARAEAMFRACGEGMGLAQALANRASHLLDASDFPAAGAAATEAIHLHRVLGSRRSESLATSTLSQIRLEEGDAAHALELALLAMSIASRCGAEDARALGAWRSGQAHLWLGRAERAIELLTTALELMVRHRPDRGPRVAANLVLGHLAAGDRAAAEQVALGDGWAGDFVRELLAGRSHPPPPRPTADDRVLISLSNVAGSPSRRR